MQVEVGVIQDVRPHDYLLEGVLVRDLFQQIRDYLALDLDGLGVCLAPEFSESVGVLPLGLFFLVEERVVGLAELVGVDGSVDEVDALLGQVLVAHPLVIDLGRSLSLLHPADELVVEADHFSEPLGLLESGRGGEVEADDLVLLHQHLADVLEMLDPPQDMRHAHQVVGLLLDLRDLLAALPLRLAAERAEPVVQAEPQVLAEVEVALPELPPALVRAEGLLADAHLVGVLAVGGEEEGDDREHEAEQSSGVGQQLVQLAVGADDAEALGGLVELEVDEVGSGDAAERNGGGGVGVEESPRVVGVVVVWQDAGVSGHAEVSDVRVSDGSCGLAEGHDDVLLDHVGDGLGLGRTNDGVDDVELYCEDVVGGAAEVGGQPGQGVRLRVAPGQRSSAEVDRESHELVRHSSRIAVQTVCLPLCQAQHLVELEAVELLVEVLAERRPVGLVAGRQLDGVSGRSAGHDVVLVERDVELLERSRGEVDAADADGDHDAVDGGGGGGIVVEGLRVGDVEFADDREEGVVEDDGEGDHDDDREDSSEAGLEGRFAVCAQDGLGREHVHPEHQVPEELPESHSHLTCN